MSYRLLSSIYYENRDAYEAQYLQRYHAESTHRFNFDIGENKAFLALNPIILQQIDAIRKLDKVFTLKAEAVPGIAIKQYRKKCLIDEINLTNDIEGVISTRKEINEILEDLTGKKKGDRLYGLIKKYELLTEDEIALNACTDIRKLYDELVLSEVSLEEHSHIPDGTIFRKDTVYIQSKTGKPIHQGVMPESKIIEVMTECLSLLKDNTLNALISIAIFHYMFGYIHPFYDGNGRISRFISSYLLARELHPIVSYRLSYIIKKNPNDYYKHFKIVNDSKNKGELTSFVIYFLNLLVQSLEDLLVSLDERIEKLSHFERQISQLSSDVDDRTRGILFILVQNTLFGETGLTVIELSDITGNGLSKVRSALAQLQDLNLASSSKSGKKLIYDAKLDGFKAR